MKAEEFRKTAVESERKARIMTDKANSAMAAAEQKMKYAEKARKSAELTVKNQKRLIRERAESLNEKFLLKWGKLIIILTVYGILSTFLMVCKSERCISDIVTAVNFMERLFTGIFERILILSDGAGSFGVPVAVLLVVGSVITLYFNGKRLVNCYKAHCMDIVSLGVFLGCTAILTGFAELIPLNYVLLMIISQAVYIFIRWNIDREKVL